VGSRVILQHNGHVEGPGGADRVKIKCVEVVTIHSDEEAEEIQYLDLAPNRHFMKIMESVANSLSGVETIIRSSRDDAHIEIAFVNKHGHEITTEEFILEGNTRLAALSEEERNQLQAQSEVTHLRVENTPEGIIYSVE